MYDVGKLSELYEKKRTVDLEIKKLITRKQKIESEIKRIKEAEYEKIQGKLFVK